MYYLTFFVLSLGVVCGVWVLIKKVKQKEHDSVLEQSISGIDAIRDLGSMSEQEYNYYEKLNAPNTKEH